MTPQIASEAAVWVARLHGPDRSHAMERECLEWQARSSAHRLAFERCTDTWQEVAGLTLTAYADAASRTRWPEGRSHRVNTRRLFLATAAIGCTALSALLLWPAAETYDTDVGEQRVVVLTDGTRMTLNTATRVRVAMSKAQRNVEVRQGEALFEVAKEPGRPFIVRVSDAHVVATGTAFLVRAMQDTPGEDAFGVTLIEGRVIVQRSGKGDRSVLAGPVTMAPGERLRVRSLDDDQARAGSSSPARLDRPRVEQLVAWTRGEAAFDAAPLADAVAEMNRYSRTPIQIVGIHPGNHLPVSGVFRTGDNEAFAQAVAALHGLTVQTFTGRIEITSK